MAEFDVCASKSIRYGPYPRDKLSHASRGNLCNKNEMMDNGLHPKIMHAWEKERDLDDIAEGLIIRELKCQIES